VSNAAPALRRTLLAWYDEHKRPLPWRRSRDPYRIWVAEVMLQQTRVEVVIPAYRRFLRAFSTLEKLASSTQEQVLAQWSGLGYYNRARSLHKAVRLLVEHRGRSFPRSLEEARRLPGVGSYTAAAVLSVSYNLPLAAVDGNVIRVLSRLRCLDPPSATGEPYHAIAQALIDRRRPGDWNQALMELGQTTCLPRSPLCTTCPIARFCAAFTRGQVDLFPRRRQRPRSEKIRVRMQILRDRRGRVLLERGGFPYLRHLWLPPAEVLSSSATVPDQNGAPAGSFRHTILHRQFDVEVCTEVLRTGDLRRAIRKASADSVERRMFDSVQLARIGRSALLTKALGVATASSCASRSSGPI
jgi:A/G-specific adenine glycosylase